MFRLSSPTSDSMDFFCSPLSTTIIAAALVLATLLFKFFFHGTNSRYHPLAGTFVHLVINFNRLHDYYTDLARTQKTFRIFGAGGTEVYTVDPANVEYILKTNFQNYGKVIKFQTQYPAQAIFSATELNQARFAINLFSLPFYFYFLLVTESTHWVVVAMAGKVSLRYTERPVGRWDLCGGRREVAPAKEASKSWPLNQGLERFQQRRLPKQCFKTRSDNRRSCNL